MHCSALFGGDVSGSFWKGGARGDGGGSGGGASMGDFVEQFWCKPVSSTACWVESSIRFVEKACVSELMFIVYTIITLTRSIRVGYHSRLWDSNGRFDCVRSSYCHARPSACKMARRPHSFSLLIPHKRQ